MNQWSIGSFWNTGSFLGVDLGRSCTSMCALLCISDLNENIKIVGRL